MVEGDESPTSELASTREYGSIRKHIVRQRRTIRVTCHTYGYYRPMLFGSVARKEDRYNSDIDLLVWNCGPSSDSFPRSKMLQLRLEKLFGRSVHIAVGDWMPPLLEPAIYSCGISLSRTGPILWPVQRLFLRNTDQTWVDIR